MPASRAATVQHRRRADQRLRADVSQFAGLIASPSNLGSVAAASSSNPLQLPANASLGLSFSVAVAAGDLSLDIGPNKVVNVPALVADRVFRRGYGEESQAIVVNRHGAPAGTATVYILDGIGRALAIATATFT